MKKQLVLAFLSLLAIQIQAQEEVEATRAVEPLFETFEYKEGDTTYVMQKYFICFYKAVADKPQISKEEEDKLQAAHMAYLGKLADEKIICISGPFHEGGNMRGMSIYVVPSKEEAEKLANADPLVKAGRLAVEILPWWAAKGSKLL